MKLDNFKAPQTFLLRHKIWIERKEKSSQKKYTMLLIILIIRSSLVT